MFKKGDRVETIDDAITGKVISVDGTIITIVDVDGFEFEFQANELINLEDAPAVNIGSLGDKSIEEITKEKESKKRKPIPAVKPKERLKPMFEVDLHIHNLTDSTRGMTNFEMLNLQLDTARGQLEFAIRKRIPKLVFIHGVGEGVLRQELDTLLSRYNNITFYDADFKTYGLGATEVRIFQNVEP